MCLQTFLDSFILSKIIAVIYMEMKRKWYITCFTAGYYVAVIHESNSVNDMEMTRGFRFAQAKVPYLHCMLG